jgi:hypothetical protein
MANEYLRFPESSDRRRSPVIQAECFVLAPGLRKQTGLSFLNSWPLGGPKRHRARLSSLSSQRMRCE